MTAQTQTRPTAIDSPLRAFVREFAQDKVSVVALTVLGLIVLLALIAPLITPQDPYDLSKLVLMDARRPPGHVGSNGFTHWLAPTPKDATCTRPSSTGCASRCRSA